MNLLIDRYRDGKLSYAVVQHSEDINLFEIDFFVKHVSIFVFGGPRNRSHRTDIMHKMTDEELLDLTREAYCTTTEEEL